MVWRAGGSTLLQPTDRDIYYYYMKMKLGGEPRLLIHNNQQPQECMNDPHFLNANTIYFAAAVTSHRCLLRFVSTQGTVLKEIPYDQPGVGGIELSKNGKVFVVDTTIFGLFDSPKPRRFTYRVYDIANGKLLLTVDVPPSLPWDGSALSPDGKLLAVGFGTQVRVYRVPVQ